MDFRPIVAGGRANYQVAIMAQSREAPQVTPAKAGSEPEDWPPRTSAGERADAAGSEVHRANLEVSCARIRFAGHVRHVWHVWHPLSDNIVKFS